MVFLRSSMREEAKGEEWLRTVYGAVFAFLISDDDDNKKSYRVTEIGWNYYTSEFLLETEILKHLIDYFRSKAAAMKYEVLLTCNVVCTRIVIINIFMNMHIRLEKDD